MCTARPIFALQAKQSAPEPEPEPEPEQGSEGDRLRNAALPKRRTTREVQESLSAEERFFIVGEEALARRAVEVEALQRCPDCWHNRNQHCGGNRCICAQLPDLMLSVNVRVLIYMHYLEWMNSGNSGKLLLKCLPKQSVQLFLYGRRQDDERLQALVAADPGRTALLFPSPDAVSLGDFVAAAAQDVNGSAGTKQDHQSQMLTLVVLDATYRKAKNMAKHFQRCIDGTGRVRCVQPLADPCDVCQWPDGRTVLAGQWRSNQKRYLCLLGPSMGLRHVASLGGCAP